HDRRGASGYAGCIASGGLCIVSAAGALGHCTVVRHAPEWVRAAESDPTFAHLCRRNGHSWRQSGPLPGASTRTCVAPAVPLRRRPERRLRCRLSRWLARERTAATV